MTPNIDDIGFDELDLRFSEFDYIKEAMIRLHLHCDGARSDDGMGFAAMHTSNGKRIGAKLVEGYYMTAFEVEWCKTSLPYYFNTQLMYIDKELFKDSIKTLYKKAIERDKKFKDERKKLFIGKSNEDLAKEFLNIEEYDGLTEKFINDAKSLKQFYKVNNYFTPKQVNYAAVIARSQIIHRLFDKFYKVENQGD